MTKKRFLIAIAIVMVLILSVAVFVACNENQTKSYTVKFVDGESEIKSVSVEEGKTIADADVPADLTKDGYVFEGWYVGDVAFDKSAAITADVTYSAKWTKLHTVKFVDGNETIKTATVKDGEKLTDADVPADAAKEGYRFNGWFVGETKITSDYIVTSDITASASYTLIGEEAGTYTDKSGVGASLVLDGCGGGTLGESVISYTISNGIVTIGDDLYKLDGTNYILNDKMAGAYKATSFGSTVVFTLDGYGSVVGVESYGSYTADPENGTYVIADDKLTMTFPDYDYWNIEYAIKENGNVLLSSDSYNGDLAYIKEGYTISTDSANAFAGLWMAEDGTILDITVENGVATVKQSGEVLEGSSFSWDYTSLVVPIPESWYSNTYTIVDGKLVKDGETVFTKKTADEIEFEIKFVVDDAVVATATVKYGEALADEDIPEDPSTEEVGFGFYAWYNGSDEFDDTTLYYADTTYTAEFRQVQNIITFMNGDQIVRKIAVDDNASFKNGDIPDAPTGDGVFLGWYCGNDKAEVGSAVASGKNVTYNALFVSQSSYVGAFVDKTNYVAAVFTEDGKASVLGIDGFSDKMWTYNATTGAAVYTEGTYTSKETWTITRVGDTLNLVYSYFEDGDPVNESYVLKKADSQVSGTYYKSKTACMIVQDGVVTTLGGSLGYGYITKGGSNIVIKYKANTSSAVQSIKGKISEDGTITINGSASSTVNGIWVKDTTECKDFYNSDLGFIYEFTKADGKLYVYRDKSDVYTLATTDKALADGTIATITYGEKQLIVKITGTNFIAAGAERGTFTAEGKDSIVFDGFGSATIGEKKYSYTINAKGVVVITGETTLGVTLDSEAKTYAEVAGDGFVHTYIDANNDKYTMLFDGFGGATLTYSTYVYSGTYTLGTGTVTVAKTNYSYNKKYTIEESGNVLVSADGSKVLKTAGYVVESKISTFDGYYVNGDNTIEIVVAEDKTFKVYFNGKAVTANANWNGTILTLKNMSDYDAAKTGWFSDFTIVKDGENIKMSHDCKQSYDSSYEEFETIAKSETFTKTTKPSGGEDLDAFAGTWKFGSVTFVFDGKGSVTVSGSYEGTYTYSIDAAGTTATFRNTAYYEDITCKLNSDGSMTVNDESSEWLNNAKFTKQA